MIDFGTSTLLIGILHSPALQHEWEACQWLTLQGVQDCINICVRHRSEGRSIPFRQIREQNHMLTEGGSTGKEENAELQAD